MKSPKWDGQRKDRIIILDNATFHKGEEIENYDALVLGFKSM